MNKSSDTHGFTIIETMLFLAVTGMLIAAILTGAGNSINVQRYRDSVQSLQGALQDQYSEVLNVRNETPRVAQSCDSNAVVVQNAAGDSRGRADCVLLGQFITTNANKTQLEFSTVVGTAPASASTLPTDLAQLQAYKLNIIPGSTQTYDIEWGTELNPPTSSSALAFSSLIVRSPTSGVVRTFTNSTSAVASNNLSSLLSTARLADSVKICMDADGMFGAGKKMAVQIVAGATSGSGVAVIGEVTSGC